MKLLDTDTCIGLLKGDDAVVSSWRACVDQCALPSMVIGELYYGAFKSTVREKELVRVDRFVDIFPEIKPSRRSMHRFGEIKATLEQKGTRLPDADIIIASIAIDEGLALVTGNVRHYSRIEGLVIENWFEKVETGRPEDHL